MTPGTDASDSHERELFRAEQNQLVWRQLRWGVSGAALFCLALVLTTPIRYPEVARNHLVAPPLLVFGMLTVTWLLGRIPALSTRPNTIIMPLGICVAAAIGWLAGETGGFSSPLYFLMLTVWIFGSTVLPLSVPVFLMDVGSQVIAGIAVMLATGPVVTSDIPVPLIVSAGALAFCVMGGVMRDRAAFEAFVAKRALANLNRDLEARVQSAVAQLHDKVQERSRELAMAIERLARSAPPRNEQLEAGSKLGDRVEIIRPLGAGGMGAVYLAIDKLTNEHVAVKVLLPGAGNSDPSALRRFVAEAGAAAAIVHPAVVRTLHVDVTSDGRLYHIMEYVDGATLTRVLDTSRLSSAVCARIGAVIA
ncbi:MAG TPA: protein kinase, partial [Kofleriaceae bacterium]